MNNAIRNWVRRTLLSGRINGKTILEVGSCDVNGSIRPYIESLWPAQYLGVDAAPGKSVDRVVDCETLTEHVGAGCWDAVISAEMMEHVQNWRACMAEMRRALSPRGLLVITTRSPGFPYHPHPGDYWRYTKDDMRRICDALNLQTLAIEDDPEMPGVFMLAANTCTPDIFDAELLAGIEVMAMRQPTGPTAVVKSWSPLPE